MSTKILITDNLMIAAVNLLKMQSDFEVEAMGYLNEKQLLEHIPEYDGLIVKTETQVTKWVVDAGKNLKVIARCGVGVDNIDVGYARSKGIEVINAPHGNKIATAEHTFTLLLALAKQLFRAHQSIVDKKWIRHSFSDIQVCGKRLGIIGLGRIGKEVARRAQAFGMEVWANDPYIPPADFAIVGAIPRQKEEIYRGCDFVSLHVPLTDETHHLIGQKELSLFVPGSYLINCARGPVIEEQALANALRQGMIAGAGIDVYETEPPNDSPLISAPNCILTPHVAPYTPEAKLWTAIEVVENVRDYFQKGVVKSPVYQ